MAFWHLCIIRKKFELLYGTLYGLLKCRMKLGISNFEKASANCELQFIKRSGSHLTNYMKGHPEAFTAMAESKRMTSTRTNRRLIGSLLLTSVKPCLFAGLQYNNRISHA